MKVQAGFKVAPSVLLTNHNVPETDSIATTSLEAVPSEPVLSNIGHDSRLVAARE